MPTRQLTSKLDQSFSMTNRHTMVHDECNFRKLVTRNG